MCDKPVHLKSLPQVGYCSCVLDKGHAHDCRCGCPTGETADSSAGGQRVSYKELAAKRRKEEAEQVNQAGPEPRHLT